MQRGPRCPWAMGSGKTKLIGSPHAHWSNLPLVRQLRMSTSQTIVAGGNTRAWQACGAIGILVAIVSLGYVWFKPNGKPGEKAGPATAAAAPEGFVELVPEKRNAMRFKSQDAMKMLGVATMEVRAAGAPEPLRLPGTLTPDPDRVVRVKARFSGETVRLGTTKDKDEDRQLRFGDYVKKDQLLAVIWSKDIGEKKSELIDVYSRMELNRTLLKRLEGLAQGVVAESKVFEARRELEADLITAAKVERTLRSWRLSDAEIDAVRDEAKSIKEGTQVANRSIEKSWAETEVRAAMSGVIVEKNFNVGDIIEHTDDLFKIADLTQLRVLAHIYEEDLWSIRALNADQRKWTLTLNSKPGVKEIEGSFELIGSVVDPGARTGVLIGWVDNSDASLAVGQFLTATIHLPALENEVAVPTKAMIEEGDRSMVFVQDGADPLLFTRRLVKISRRSSGMMYLHAELSPQDKAAGLETLAAGEKVIVSSALGLGGELEKLQSLLPAK